MAILLSTMAVETQMSWLFFKWKELGGGLLHNEVTSAHREKWEAEWTDMRTIGKRLDELSRLLTRTEFDNFAQQNMRLLGSHLKGFDPATSVKAFFQDRLFAKRNQIIHYGNIDFDLEAGASSLSLSLALLGLLESMDKTRFNKLEEDFRRTRV